MKRNVALVLFLFLFPCMTNAGFFDTECPTVVSGSGATFEPAFSLDGRLSDTLMKSIQSAKSRIRVIAHRFVSKPLALALVNAAKSGKDVKIILDKSTAKDGYSDAGFFMILSRPPHYLPNYQNQYDEFIVIDDSDVIVGNISSLPEVDDEKKNLAGVLVIHNAKDLAKTYADHWEKLWLASEEMKKK